MSLAPDLVLVPTRLERDQLQNFLPANRDFRWEVCGFGPVYAAAHTAWLLSQQLPRRVFLLGIAGAYRGNSELGCATQFSRVNLFGVGAGSGAAHTPSCKLQFMASEPGLGGDEQGIPLHFAAGLPCEPLLLSVCSAAADPLEVEHRLEQHPNASAEDMEAFGVALACAKFNIPLYVIRGISNAAGDRNTEQWRTQPALQAAAQLFQAVRETSV